jgi:prevent-host-death family protein
VRSWKLEDAKNQFSRVVREALTGRPQRVTRAGKDAVVVIAAEEYERLTRPRVGLVEFLQKSPLAEALTAGELDLTRSGDAARDVDL